MPGPAVKRKRASDSVRAPGRGSAAKGLTPAALRRRLEAGATSTLQAIPGVAQSLAGDLEGLGVTAVSQLRERDAVKMFEALPAGTDRCVLYVFRCARYFALTYGDEAERATASGLAGKQATPAAAKADDKCKWWNWSDAKATREMLLSIGEDPASLLPAKRNVGKAAAATRPSKSRQRAGDGAGAAGGAGLGAPRAATKR